MKRAQGFLKTVPRRSLVIFAIGVFALFGTLGVTGDIGDMGRGSVWRVALSVLLVGGCAILYAGAGVHLRAQAWKAAIPIFIVQFLFMNALRRWLPNGPLYQKLEGAELTRVTDRLGWDAVAIMIGTIVGYCCFVYASVSEGRRYFRAHAEIALAQEIHRVLVPAIDTKMGGFEFYGRSTPSAEVGGDLIDLAGTDDKWVAYLADVSGHGVAPGVVMGMAKSASRMLLSSGDDSERLMPRLNEVLYPLKKPDMFITFCFVAGNAGRLRVGLAGHPSILQFSAQTNEVTQVECPNMPLGILPEGEFTTSEVSTTSGTLFALYTDGLLEATNTVGEEFGVERFKAELQKHGKKPLPEISAAIHESVARHGAQFDDQSILLVRQT
jgi:sigma-B regulation protein RsbU (phosphoserine phosphatase)